MSEGEFIPAMSHAQVGDRKYDGLQCVLTSPHVVMYAPDIPGEDGQWNMEQGVVEVLANKIVIDSSGKRTFHEFVVAELHGPDTKLWDLLSYDAMPWHPSVGIEIAMRFTILVVLLSLIQSAAFSAFVVSQGYSLWYLVPAIVSGIILALLEIWVWGVAAHVGRELRVNFRVFRYIVRRVTNGRHDLDHYHALFRGLARSRNKRVAARAESCLRYL